MLVRRWGIILLSVLAALLPLGCANKPTPSTVGEAASVEPQDGQSNASGRYIDWKTPFGNDAPSFSTVAQAQAEVPFEIVTPSSWGPPESIQIAPPSSIVDPADEQIAFVFDLPVEGRILLEENLAGDYSLEVLEQLAKDHATEPAFSSDYPSPTPGPFLPAFQMIQLRQTQALLIQGSGVGRVMWIEKGLLFDILGETVTPDQVIKLAETL